MAAKSSKPNKKKKEEEKIDLIPNTITQTPPPEPMPRDLTFEKQPGIVLKENGILFMDKEFNQENCMPLVKMIMEGF